MRRTYKPWPPGPAALTKEEVFIIAYGAEQMSTRTMQPQGRPQQRRQPQGRPQQRQHQGHLHPRLVGETSRATGPSQSSGGRRASDNFSVSLSFLTWRGWSPNPPADEWERKMQGANSIEGIRRVGGPRVGLRAQQPGASTQSQWRSKHRRPCSAPGSGGSANQTAEPSDPEHLT